MLNLKKRTTFSRSPSKSNSNTPSLTPKSSELIRPDLANDLCALEVHPKPARKCSTLESTASKLSYHEGKSMTVENSYSRIGLSILHTPTNNQRPIADIVCIHGLTGDPISTFTARNESEPWVKTVLAQDIPNVRYSTFGYDAGVVKPLKMVSQAGVRDHGRNLNHGLANLREKTGTSDIPLIFIAHSLGGLVCEEALIVAKISEEKSIREIWQHSLGIFFLGTPHNGSYSANWARRSASFFSAFQAVNTKLLNVLRPGSELSRRIQEDFHSAIRGRTKIEQLPELNIVCFFEELPVRGLNIMIVDSASASFSPSHPAIGIHANHMDMARIQATRDQSYCTILHCIKSWLGLTSPLSEKSTDLAVATPRGSTRSNTGGTLVNPEDELDATPAMVPTTGHEISSEVHKPVQGTGSSISIPPMDKPPMQDPSIARERRTYVNISAADESFQVNGNVGAVAGHGKQLRGYANIQSKGQSRQINGDLTDSAFLARAFFGRDKD